jgi:ParB/RepB/Spo0J family partition protein
MGSEKIKKIKQEITYIEIDKLFVDRFNIRRGVWDKDPEIIRSVGTVGIMQPLIVRPTAQSDEETFGIICGSRRFNAAIEAGLDSVPCIINELDDIDAMAQSMIENRQRKPSEAWMEIQYIGTMAEKRLSIKKISEKTSLSKPTIEKYIEINKLPIEVKGLLREPQDRTELQNESISLYQVRSNNRTLPIGHAYLLTQIVHVDFKKLMEVAIFILNTPSNIAQKIINSINVDPKSRLTKIYKSLTGQLGSVSRNVVLDKILYDALSNACVEKQMHYTDLIKYIMLKWVRENNYLEKTRPGESKIDNFVKICVSQKILEKDGYKFLKKEGNNRIFQKPATDIAGKGSGFLKARFYKGD